VFFFVCLRFLVYLCKEKEKKKGLLHKEDEGTKCAKGLLALRVPWLLRLLHLKKNRRRRVFLTKKTKGKSAKELFRFQLPSLLGLLGVKKNRRRRSTVFLTKKTKRQSARRDYYSSIKKPVQLNGVLLFCGSTTCPEVSGRVRTADPPDYKSGCSNPTELCSLINASIFFLLFQDLISFSLFKANDLS
jgi:hypothetical protein